MKKIHYKGTDKDMKCEGFQYELGKKYECRGKIELCRKGFHACKNPFDVFKYYRPDGNNRFFVVEQSGKMKDSEDKTVSQYIEIKSELSLRQIFEIGFKNIFDTKRKTSKKTQNTSNNFAHANTLGDFAHANTSGDFAYANTSGYHANANTSGEEAHANTSGNEACANTSGDEAHANTSGYRAHANTSGYRAHANTSGWQAHARVIMLTRIHRVMKPAQTHRATIQLHARWESSQRQRPSTAGL